MEELIARRQFAPQYIWLDIAFLLLYLGLQCTELTLHSQ